MGLGGLGSFLFLHTQTLTATVTPPSSVVIATPSLQATPIPAAVPAKLLKPATYTVKSGDNLSFLAKKFCGRGTPWQVMVKANPHLKGREDYIDIGEVSNISQRCGIKR
ncbi:hypothetical protein CEN44_07525 [Fischerella muscicola CCMEE 5323]|uniref:LysM domain-containing protein n=2 Tax=Fischerella muscicola TaxID=92938 RepID=A0A2N6K5I6_FISMU|nr:hypothetical protein CEN44_07525 [Fischerella muscicola CCMEE 5323]